MGINVNSSFDVNAGIPLDSRSVVPDIAARDAIVTGRRYEGMKVYVEASQANYQLVGGVANANWTALTGGGGSDILTGEVTSPSGSTATTLDKSAIANRTLVTAEENDELLIQDASDGELKKVNTNTLLDGGNF